MKEMADSRFNTPAMRFVRLCAAAAFAVTLACGAARSTAAPMAAQEQEALAAKRVYIIHGYAASPSDHWFPWLKKELADAGVQVSVLALPDPHAPDPTRWQEYLASNIASHNADTFFVAHSLGCIALLRHLQTLDPNRKIGGIVLVSGFAVPLPELPQLDPFTTDDIDPRHIIRIAPQRAVVAARDDRIVPYRFTENLSRDIGAPLHSVDRGGHFLASDGFLELPVVYDILMAMLTERAPSAH